MIGGPFRRRRDGTIEATLSEVEASALQRVARDLEGAVDEPDEAMYRLFPPAYAEDAERQSSFEEMTRGDLVEGKKRAARALVASIEAGSTKRGRWSGTLDDETAHAWLGVLNDARLILGTRLGVTEETEHRMLPESDARAPAHNLYLYLGGIEEYLIDALFPGLVVSGDDEPG
jgi:hypothetical protein